MTQAVTRPHDEQVSNPDNRLESWKEIARYLSRGVRTVQRWERVEGLPIHRHRHDKRGTVYAFRSEIDAWREDRKQDANAAPVGSSPSLPAQDRGGFVSIVERMFGKLRSHLPADWKKRIPVRILISILPS